VYCFDEAERQTAEVRQFGARFRVSPSDKDLPGVVNDFAVISKMFIPEALSSAGRVLCEGCVWPPPLGI
jgi:hypothetical protein